ncbi:MAG TPA: hypothetical protein VF502_19090 [Stellaceae bacterium]
MVKQYDALANRANSFDIVLFMFYLGASLRQNPEAKMLVPRDMNALGVADRSFAIFGRFRSPTGRVSDVAIDGRRLAKSIARLPAMGNVDELLTAAAELATRDCPPKSRPIAVVAVGFGPAAAGSSSLAWWKGDFDENKHRRWPAGAPDSQGGQFRPKDDAAGGTDERKARLKAQVSRRAAREAIRIKVLAALRIAARAVTNAIPGVGEADDVLIAADIIRTAAELHQLETETAAALAFVAHAPYSLDELRVTSEYETFSSARAFAKDITVKRFGPAGSGYQYHHIVEQGGGNEENIPPEQLHSTENMIRMPTLVHEAITAKMYDEEGKTGMTVREWLRTQPYEVQRERGIQIMRDLGIIR